MRISDWRSDVCSSDLTAVATSAALGFPIAVANVAGYIVSGMSVTDLPPGSFGYISLPALGLIAAASVFTATLGAQAAQHLPVQKLTRVFAGMLYALAIGMASCRERVCQYVLIS